MPLYEPNTRFSDCWSSVGDITFFHRDGKCFWKTKPVCVFPGTAGQLDQGDLHRRALAAWRTVEHSDQEVWNDYAKSVTSHRPPFDSSSHITSHHITSHHIIVNYIIKSGKTEFLRFCRFAFILGHYPCIFPLLRYTSVR